MPERMMPLALPPDNKIAERYPIFIVGSPRSGTSMLHWALCEHEALWGSEESALFLPFTQHLDAVCSRARKISGRNWLESQDVDRDEFFAHLGKGIEALYASRAVGRHWLEQTPSNTWALPDILRLLPSARFLFIHRDGRQVVESMTSMWPWSFRKAVKTWQQANHLAMDFEQRNPDVIMRISYESLVLDTEPELLRIWQFLGLRPCPESIRFIAEKQPINVSPQHRDQDRLQKLEPRYTSWSWPRRLLFKKIAAEEMGLLGYRLDDDRHYPRLPDRV